MSAAEELAQKLVEVGCGAGLETRAVLSDMNQPLGFAVGNALEVEEAIQCLKGDGPAELSELVCNLIGDPAAKECLASGAAFEKWEQMVVAQGGNPNQPLRGAGCQEMIIKASHSGTLERCDALKIGQAALHLGAGRFREEQEVHHGVGVLLHCKVGQELAKGQPIFTVRHADKGLARARTLLDESLLIRR